MANLAGVVQQLRKERNRAAKELGRLDAALAALNGAGYAKRMGTRGGMSATGRARVAAAQRARWAKLRASQGKKQNAAGAPKRTFSPATRERMARAQRLRWSKVKKTAA